MLEKKNWITEGQIVFSAIAIFKQPLLIRRRIKFDFSMAYLEKLNPFESPNNLNNREQRTVKLGLSKWRVLKLDRPRCRQYDCKTL